MLFWYVMGCLFMFGLLNASEKVGGELSFGAKSMAIVAWPYFLGGLVAIWLEELENYLNGLEKKIDKGV
jgi:hypothetical protein